jgi:hypothetical protein
MVVFIIDLDSCFSTNSRIINLQNRCFYGGGCSVMVAWKPVVAQIQQLRCRELQDRVRFPASTLFSSYSLEIKRQPCGLKARRTRK